MRSRAPRLRRCRASSSPNWLRSPEQGKEEGLHPQRAGLDQTVLRHCGALDLPMRQSLPVYPRKQTLSVRAGMSQKCQHATSRALSGLTRRVTIDRVNGLINDLLGKRHQPCRYFETECFRRPRVDDYHELSGCCTGKSAGFSPLRIRLT
jgi:hypothetical protein